MVLTVFLSANIVGLKLGVRSGHHELLLLARQRHSAV